MNKADRDRILARKQAREDALLKRTKRARKARPAAPKSPVPSNPSPPPSAPAPDLSTLVTEFIDAYAAAQVELARQRARLIAMRGGEENLTEEDLEALENIRDIVSARYERLLEV